MILNFKHVLSAVNACLFFGLVVISAPKGKCQSVTIPIETASNAIVLRADSSKHLSIIYFGRKLREQKEYLLLSSASRRGDDYSGVLNSAYTTSGSTNLAEPALSVTHADGNQSLDLRYRSHSLKKEGENIVLVSVLLRDPVYPFEVELFYRCYLREDIVEQWSVIRHHEKTPVTLRKFASANLYLQSEKYFLRQYHGDWAKEMQPEDSQLTHGIRVLDSKLGTRANLYQPPSFMLSLDRPSSEDEGKVLLGTLAWSGNFRFDLEVDPLNNLRLLAGINNFSSDYRLGPSEDFATPAFIFTYSENGRGKASRNLQQWARIYRIPKGTGERLTLLNNWEATYFDFDEQKLTGLIGDAKKLGVDLFLLDDGWFGNSYPRNDDHAGLGDWAENRKKLPSGIGYLVGKAKEWGVGFGIWIEPEMVNPRSDLYTRHPEWVIRQPERPEHLYRNQLVLDLSNPRVQEFIFGVIDTLMVRNPGLAYLKWDCNAVIYNAYSATISSQSNLYVEYVRGLYSVLSRLRRKYPDLQMMLCSGGGGRVDYGGLGYFNEFWPSDNTDPLERIFMQWEYSYFFPSIASANHVTDWGKQPIKFRTDVAMMGKLGFDIVTANLPEKDLQFCREAIAFYRSQREQIWHGNQYRLQSPWEGNCASLMYVDPLATRGIVFNYLTGTRYGASSTMPIRLKGLSAAKSYTVSEANLYPGTRSALSEEVYSGDYLMTVGIDPQLGGTRTSVVLEVIEKVSKAQKPKS